MPHVEGVTISVDGFSVSGRFLLPHGATACFVFAHGAGAGIDHIFMHEVSEGLAERSIGTLRYAFPSSERQARRPDPPAVCHATVRAAVAEAARRAPGLALIAGGKSFGGRMTSQAQAIEPLQGVRGLAFLGFPLHPPGKPGTSRGDHLSNVRVPMIFIQGTRDTFAAMSLLQPLLNRLGSTAILAAIPDADHGFHVLRRVGRTDAQALLEVLDAFSGWVKDVLR